MRPSLTDLQILYRHLYEWARFMNSSSQYIADELQKAYRLRAPDTTIYFKGDVPVLYDDCKSQMLIDHFTALGLLKGESDYRKILKAGIGAAVRCKVPCMRDLAGSRAIVYEVYHPNTLTPGISLLSESGSDWGGFAKETVDATLTYLGKIELDYEFIASYNLAFDIKRGHFRAAIEALRKL